MATFKTVRIRSILLLLPAFVISAPASSQELTKSSCQMLEAALIDSYVKEAREVRTLVEPQVKLANQFFSSLDAQERKKIKLFRDAGFPAESLRAELHSRMRAPGAAYMRPVFECSGDEKQLPNEIAVNALGMNWSCGVDRGEGDLAHRQETLRRSYFVGTFDGAVVLRACALDNQSTSLQHVLKSSEFDQRGEVCIRYEISPSGLWFAGDTTPGISVDRAVTYVMGTRAEWVGKRLGGCEEILRPGDSSAALQLTDSDTAERELLATGPAQRAGQGATGDAAI